MPTAQDNTDEENETFTVTLTDPSSNALIAEATAQGTINDDDDPPVLSVAAVDAEVTEGESATFTLTLTPASGKRVTVGVASSDFSPSTATQGADLPGAGRPAGLSTGRDIEDVVGADDRRRARRGGRGDLRTARAFSTNATLEGGASFLRSEVTILDNDDTPTLSVADVSAEEGDGLTFTVRLSAVSGREVTVDWEAATLAAEGDDAEDGTDYTADSGTLTFAPAGVAVFDEFGSFLSHTPGEKRKTFTVATTEDADEEENETFTVTLSNASNASIAEATARGMINNDDAATLVSNTEQTSISTAANATRNTFAVQFTTGDNANGYQLDSIGLKVSAYENVAVTVALYSDDSGNPGSSVFTFDNPPAGITADAVNTFTSPDDDVLTHLDAMTPYFIVVSGQIDTNLGSTFDFLLAATDADVEDMVGEDDWEIADERHSLSGTTWSTDSATLQIRVFGYPATGICGRTAIVQELILYYLEEAGVVRTCAEVNAADLASFTTMEWASEDIGPLRSGDFAGLTKVTELGLSFNDFTTLPADLFSDMTALKSINLVGGKLTSLPDGVFSGLTELTILGLDRNDLVSLPAGVFSGLTALETLTLSGNDLVSLPAGLFSGLTALEHLHLHGNDLTALPDELLSGLTALELLVLSDNPNTDDVLPLTVTVEKVGTNQARAKVLAGAPFAVDFNPTVVNGALAGGATTLGVATGSVDGTAVTVTRTSGKTEAVTVDIDLTTQPTPPSGHGGYTFARATSGLPATILPASTDADGGNAVPEFSSSATFDAAENQTAAGTVVATDSDADDNITGYAITGGADQARFEINGTNGELTFKTAPDYETPSDADTDNVYEVTVMATSGAGARVKTATQMITVTVNNIGAPGKPAKPTVTAVTGLAELSVTWQEPDLNGGPAITGYRVDYRKEPHGRWTRSSYSGTDASTTIDGLTAHTEYQVRVRATNAEGTGERSDPSDAVRTEGPTCTLDPDDPGDVWCGVVTVGDTTFGYGYSVPFTHPDPDQSDKSTPQVGGLSDRNFMFRDEPYTIDFIVVERKTTDFFGGVLFSLTSRLGEGREDLVLYIGDTSLSFTGARAAGSAESYTSLWPGDNVAEGGLVTPSALVRTGRWRQRSSCGCG